MDIALRALGHPVRLSLLRELCSAEHTVSQLADSLALRQPATSQHLAVLRDARLVAVRRDGNRRLYRANHQELARLRAFLDTFWKDSLQALKTAAEARARGGRRR